MTVAKVNSSLEEGMRMPTALSSDSEDGRIQVSSTDFLAEVFHGVPEGAFAAACSLKGDPETAKGWNARFACELVGEMMDERNNYINCSSFFPEDDGSCRARKINFAAYHFILLDDLGSKVLLERLAGFELSWLLETSPGNHQGGIILANPVTDAEEAEQLLATIIEAGLCDRGAHGPLTRWARLPRGINGKAKNLDENGKPFVCRLVTWAPEKRYTPQEIVDGLQLELPPAGRPKRRTNHTASRRGRTRDAIDILTPKPVENPVLQALKERKLYKTHLGPGKHDITCPWVHEHTDQLDTGAAYFEPDEYYPIGGFCCLHSHRDKYNIGQLLEFLDIHSTEARHKPVIRIVQGDLHSVVDAAEKVLAGGGNHYQAGGLIVCVSTDPTSGAPSILPLSTPALTRELSIRATWEKYDARSSDWVRTDPPERHTVVLYNAQKYRHLPPLAGLARQPYFRESDGELVTQAGYDEKSKLFGVFDAQKFIIPDQTRGGARKALARLEDLLDEFRFVNDTDRAAALSAMFTAVVRAALSYAPGFHINAPASGSGKSYLSKLISAFAGPGLPAPTSYPTTSEEATKVILSLLLTNPAVINFDDMATDWLPHGVINRVLTEKHISDRILGVSKTATVSTRTLFLGSGNNVGPVRDLLRRVLTIHIDPRCATPSTIQYTDQPVERVRRNRARYVSQVLGIILAWRKAGAPRADVENIATYGNAWSDYCRHPLMWLGLPDPATALLDQIKHDPDGEALEGLLKAWYAEFESGPTTVRRAVEKAKFNCPDLKNAICELPVEEKGEINPSKLGWLLKKNANRIVDGLKFEKCAADGRTAWRVVKVS